MPHALLTGLHTDLRQRFLEQVNAAHADLRADPRTWEAVLTEHRAWDVTLPDGIAVADGRPPYEARSRPKRSRKRR